MVDIERTNSPSQLLYEKISDIYVTLLLTFYLLSLPNLGYTQITSFKYGLFLALCGGYVSVISLLALEYRMLYQEKIPLFHQCKKICLMIGLYVIFTLVSSLFSPYPNSFLGNSRQEGALTITLYGLSTCYLICFYKCKQSHLQMAGISSTLFCVLGMIQLFGINPFKLYPEGLNFYDGGVFYEGKYWSSVGNVNLCAAVLSATAGFSTVQLIQKWSKRNACYIIPLFLTVFFSFFLESDASTLAVCFGFFLLLPILVTSVEKLTRYILVFSVYLFAISLNKILELEHSQDSWGLVCLFLLSLVLFSTTLFLLKENKDYLMKKLRMELPFFIVGLFAFYYLYFGTFSQGICFEIKEILHGRMQDSFGSARIYIWKQVIALVPERFFLGGGPDTLAFRGIPNFSNYNMGEEQSFIVDAAHNELLNILVNQGFLALIAFLLIVISTLYRFLTFPKHHVLVGGAVVVYYQIQAFFGISTMITAPFFWLAVAVVHSDTDEIDKKCCMI